MTPFVEVRDTRKLSDEEKDRVAAAETERERVLSDPATG